MRHIIFEDEDKYSIAILIKATAFKKYEIINNYLNEFNANGVDTKEFIAYTLKYNEVGKAPVKYIKDYLSILLPELQEHQIKYLYVTDANYFKVLTNSDKADPHIGYVLPCTIKGYEYMQVVLGVNYQALIYNPELQSKLSRSIKALASSINNTYIPVGHGIIHSAEYPKSYIAIADMLQKLHSYPVLTCDIETFSLRFNEAGVGTISFAWDKHNGCAFACDYEECFEVDGLFGTYKVNLGVRKLLKIFFESYKGRLIFHSATFDIKILIYTLWMTNILDMEGLYRGLDILTERMDDTKIIAYLATNSTAGNALGLKVLAHEFAGNWAMEEIQDIRKIPLDELLEYNLVDGLSTHYVFEKYYPIMEQDNQGELYRGLMLDTINLLIQVELTGMPMSRTKVIALKNDFVTLQQEYLNIILNSNEIKEFQLILQIDAMNTANAKLKVKQHPLSKFEGLVFNPNSGVQLQKLLYQHLDLPILDLTATKQPATDSKVMNKLLHHVKVPSHKVLIEALNDYAKVSTILSTFMPAFERAIKKDDSDTVWLHGSFNLGVVVSGRLSSSDPNLQNIPANSVHGSRVKEAFVAHEGWLMVGADFNSLEDMISALTTKDPQKLKVYTDGYDGHCLRAHAYFKNDMPDIILADKNERCFEISVNGEIHFIKCGTLVSCPDGVIRKVEDYYDMGVNT